MVPMPAAKPTSAKTFALAAKPVKKVAAAKPAPRSRIAEYPHGLFNFR
jgi:hypothetical protein